MITKAGSVQFLMVRRAAEIGWTAILPERRQAEAGQRGRSAMNSPTARMPSTHE